jgi:FkbM family methyltransferase
MLIIKKIIIFFFNILGYNISRIDNKYKKLSFNDIHKIKIDIDNPLIFDVGANKGQSIRRFKKIFANPIIHAFEPNEEEFAKLQDEFKNDKSIFLNNFALGEAVSQKKFNIMANTGHSSFYKLNPDTEWLKIRSKEFGLEKNEYEKKVVEVKIDTINNYCNKNNISFIHILKLDAQGYEEKILAGASQIISKIKLIETEIMFDNVYEKRLSFYDIEKHIINHNFRLIAIEPLNFSNLLEGYMFCVDAIYFNEKNI